MICNQANNMWKVTVDLVMWTQNDLNFYLLVGFCAQQQQLVLQVVFVAH
jgi:hypothetical protein